MSGGAACRHLPRIDHAVVIVRDGNHSAFNGYLFTPSAYSSIRCLTCGARWRSKAGYVAELRDARGTEAYRVIEPPERGRRSVP